MSYLSCYYGFCYIHSLQIGSVRILYVCVCPGHNSDHLRSQQYMQCVPGHQDYISAHLGAWSAEKPLLTSGMQQGHSGSFAGHYQRQREFCSNSSVNLFMDLELQVTAGFGKLGGSGASSLVCCHGDSALSEITPECVPIIST